jgi:ABC-type antimicrobial peptide transport system permease subunit
LPGNVVRLVVGEGARVTAVGVGIGFALSLAASRSIAPLLFGISPRDPLVYASVGALLVTVSVAASAIPALRASRVDPNTALRAE